MKLKYLLFIIFSLILILPMNAWDINFDFKKEQQEISNVIQNSQVENAKKEMLDALARVNRSKEIRDPEAIMNFGKSMKMNMKFLPKNERMPFLKQLRAGLVDETLKLKADYYFIAEEALAKPNFTKTTVVKSAETFVDKLYKILFSGNSQKLENATRILKQDIIKLVSQGDVELFETFIKTYTLQANKYGLMSRSLNLFLYELMNHNLPLTLMKNTTVTKEALVRNTIPILLRNFSWKKFVTEHQGTILQDLFNSQQANKFHLSNFTKMIGDTYLDKAMSQAERELQSKISVLANMSRIAEHRYQELKPKASHGFVGERTLFRRVSLGDNFGGDLTPQNAKELSRMIRTIPASKMEHVLPNAKEWIKSFSSWAKSSIKSKGNTILTITTMIALVAAEEFIKSYTSYNPSESYLNSIDEITDNLSIGNNIKLVYNTVYDNNFAKHFSAYTEEGNLTEDEQLAYMETFDNFETAIYASYFQNSDNITTEKAWQCFALNENCTNEI
ncbi:MAG: hypothetical protein J5594_01670 [Elusimicrobiaceae bacterium]|nr:hypothetical protein [Elusimicrobiaceae bacterium]